MNRGAGIPFRPLAIGPPRSGFDVLCDVLMHISPFGAARDDLREALLALFVAQLGDHVGECVAAAVADHGLEQDLIYGAGFRRLTGGPRYVEPGRPGRICYRKYIGIRGPGEILLVVSHPLALLRCEPIAHAHGDPDWWADCPSFHDHVLYASLRNPAAIVNSCFSLNEMVLEYIDRFMPSATDQNTLRDEIALHKLSNRRFFEGIVRFYVDYFRSFLPVRHRYAVMRWEDLLQAPTDTIEGLARAADLPGADKIAALAGKNLQHGAPGGGLGAGRRDRERIGRTEASLLTHHHLDWMRAMGLETVAEALGYPPFEAIEPSAYTPFQRQLDELIRRGHVYRPAVSDEVLAFASNKSNLDAASFEFRGQAWRAETRIERSTLNDAPLEGAIADAAEAAAARFNRLLEDVLGLALGSRGEAEASLHGLRQRHAASLRPHLPKRYDAAFAAAQALIAESAETADGVSAPDQRPPLLVGSRDGYNFVAYRGKVVRLPQALGPIDLEREDPTGRPGVAVLDGPQALETLLGDGVEAVLR